MCLIGNEFETVTISDGLGRAIQVKKKSTIYGVDSVVVSGKIIFDKLGRQEQVYQPETEVYNGAINHSYSNLSWQNPTTYIYDIMDRPRLQNNPDGTHISYNYGFGVDNFGKICFKTNITDPNGKVTEQYKDARGLQTTVVAPMNTITSFIYTSLGQIKTSIDPEYNSTNYHYDMLGRLIEREHPDAGITQYDYDMAGNIIKKMSENSDINYRYQEGRLSNILYPGNEEMDVYYEYGAAGSGNQSGRLIKQQDASGVQTFWYGNMGELVGNRHTYVVPGGEPYTFEMRWQYDSWNRLINIQYPDGELVNYYYDNGGKLIRMNGAKFGNEYNYINRIFYDKYDSRVHIDYGNSTYSDYSYDPLNRRLINLKSYNHSGLKMQDIVYIYDGVGNIMHQFNNGEYVDGEVGGPYNYNYQYDDLYRLIGAGGAFISYQFGNIGYNMAMSYSPSGNITNKQINGQTLINGGVNNINYNRDYFYDSRPHQVTISGENTYEWDSNGNMIGRRTPQGIRSQCWDNEDRLTAVNDAGSMPQLSAYLYDDGGERVWKLTGGVIQNYMNGQQIYNSVHLDKTLYASPYMVMTEQEYTKHYYIEGERICSKIGGGFEWAHTPPTSTPIDFIEGNPYTCSMHLRDMVDRNTQCARYNGDIYMNPDLQPALNDGNKYEGLQYFYHSDHLGSASFVTDREGAVCQHIQYLPFGELFVSQRNCEFDSRYKFTAKELDNETSYTYFGARYYDSDLSVWLSVDKLSDKYPSISPYAYAANNPVKLIDPNGDSLWINGSNGEKFLYTPGQEYKGSDEFIAKAANTLNESIGKSNTANRMVGELSESEYNYNIIQSDESNYTPDNQTTTSDYLSSEIFYKKGGGTIQWNPTGNGESTYEQSSPGKVIAKLAKRPDINLLHELAHAWDNMAGLLTNEQTSYKGLKVSEWTGVRTENMIRKEMGLPLRTHYGVIENNGGPSYPPLLDLNCNYLYDKFKH
jgi:RHS repeat-associated protein